MTTSTGLVLRFGAVCVLAVMLAAVCPKASYAQSDSTGSGSDQGVKNQPAAKGDSGAAVNSAGSDDQKADSSDDSGATTPGAYSIHAALKSMNTAPRDGDDAFSEASDLFPAFCKDWQRRLHDRELNNLENITWKDENGWKTGTYVSYSPVKTCNCKRSTGGVPIGELTYQETELYLAGHTVEEARHAQPKPVGITNTTEIFRWDKTKWDDGR
jgi:hypothetical protein